MKRHYNTLLITPDTMLFFPREGTDFRNYLLTPDGTLHLSVLA